jgi:hypothetical protein
MSDAVLPGASSPRTLTSVLLAPLGPLAAAHRAAVLETAARVPGELADLAARRPGGGSLRLTDHDIRTAMVPPDHRPAPTPFAWSARTARRALGLAAVRRLANGEGRSPADAVRLTVADAVRLATQGSGSVSSVDRWLTGLPSGGVAAVQAEAVTWATRLWCALDWGAFTDRPDIGRDRWWDSPHSSLLAIRSRAEVRAVALDPGGDPYSVHLVVLGGPRRASVRSELSVVAMVEALLAPASLPPGRIVGWWPDSGHLIAVEVDQAAVRAGVAAVTGALARVGAAPTPFGREERAAA